MRRRHFIAAAAATLGADGIMPRFAAAAAPPAMLSAAQAAPIADAVAKTMAATGTLGVSVTVARGGEIVYANGFGLRDVAANLPVDAATIFPIGSITKQFTATAIMLLARDRKLQLDAKAAEYVPLAPHATEYTVRQLLQQTTGLANYTAVPAFLATVATSATVTPEAMVALIAREPLAFAPGSQFAYSNTNYVVLGMIVEAVARMPYGRFIAERIARPLGLAQLTFGPPPRGSDLARGYEPQTGTAAVTPWTPQATFAAGGLYATPADLVRWDEAFFGARLLDAAAVRAMTTPPALAGSTPSTYAMGWLRDEIDGHTMIWHNGGVIGANTRNAYFPDQRISVVVFGNSVSFEETRIVRAAFRALVPPSEAQLAAERRLETMSAAGEDVAITAAAKAEYERWRAGDVDPSRYSAQMRAELSAMVRQVSPGLTALGAPTAFVYRGRQTPPGFLATAFIFRVTTPNGAVQYVYTMDHQGKIAGIYFKPVP
ncbi:MAG TPA: serine hydrolase domain-containing protein [Candidatus Elarobacter sp.]|nr:serine hydrolase domain-containing protein [Candidatus Elarobacter sp.]